MNSEENVSNWDKFCESAQNMMELHNKLDVTFQPQQQCPPFQGEKYDYFRRTIEKRVIGDNDWVLLTTKSGPKLEAFNTVVSAKNITTMSFAGTVEQPFGYIGNDRESYVCARHRCMLANQYLDEHCINTRYVVAFENGIELETTILGRQIFNDLCDVVVFDRKSRKEYSTAQLRSDNLLKRQVPYDVMAASVITGNPIGVAFAELYSDVDWMKYSGISRAEQLADSLAKVMSMVPP